MIARPLCHVNTILWYDRYFALWDMSLKILGKFQFFVKFGVIFKETIWASRIIITIIIKSQNWQRKLLKNSNIKKFFKLCPNFDGPCMNDGSKYLSNSFAKIFYNIPELLSCYKICKFCNFKIQHCSRMSRFLFPFLSVMRLSQ